MIKVTRPPLEKMKLPPKDIERSAHRLRRPICTQKAIMGLR
jgi:hypothetical protein